MIIQRHGHDETPDTLSTVYGIRWPTVYDIIKNKDKMEKFMQFVASELGDRKMLKNR